MNKMYLAILVLFLVAGLAVFFVFGVRYSEKKVGVWNLDVGTSASDLQEQLSYSAWISEELPSNVLVSCKGDSSHRVCSHISAAVLRVFYPKQKNAEIYRAIEMTFTLSLGRKNGATTSFSFYRSFELPGLPDEILKAHDEQIGYLNTQLTALKIPQVKEAIIDKRIDSLFAVQDNELFEEQVIRSLICSSFDSIFRRSLDGERVLKEQFASTALMLNSMNNCLS